MKKLSALFFFLFTLMLFSSNSVQAQFWKKIFKKDTKEQTRDKGHEKSNDRKKDGSEKLKKRTLPIYPESVKKERYRIDILLPLQLNELVSNGKAVHKKLPAQVLPVVNFYEGIKMAADSLNSLNYPLDIYIHDITDRNQTIPNLIRNGQLKQSDLIIGYLQSREFQEIETFSKTEKINFLSALSPSDSGIQNNPYFILLQPNLSTHIEHLMDFAMKRNKRNPKYVFYLDNTPVQKEAFQIIQQNLGDNDDYIAIDCSQPRFNQDSLRTILDSTRINVIFINILSNAKVDPILKEFSKLSSQYQMEIYGMPSWKSLPGLYANNDYPGLNIFYTNPFYFDAQSGSGKAIMEKYKQDYGGTASELVFRGFESLFWMSDLLVKYGTIFNKHIQDTKASPFTRYNIQYEWSPQNDFLYLGNENLYIFHFQNGYFNIER